MKKPILIALLVASTPLMTACSTSTAAENPQPRAPHPLPMTLALDVDLANAGWLSLTVSTAKLPWTIVGCESSARGVCRASRRIPLSAAQRREYVTAINAIRAMPLCEPVQRLPGDHRAYLGAPGLTAETWLPARWLKSGKVPKTAVADPCSAEQRLVFFIARAFGTKP
jgi:hypothetical protein